MDFETQDRRPETGELPQNDATAGTERRERSSAAAGTGKKRRRHWPVVLLIVLVLLLILGAAYWLSGLRVRVERTESAFALVVETGKPEPKTPTPTEPVGPSAYLGSGKTMNIVPAAPGVPNRPSSAEDALSLQEFYEKIMPCVVSIRAERLRGSVSGVGVILSENGYIITNARTVDRALELVVTVNGREPQEAVLVGSDAAGDVAVLKIDAADLQPAVFGDSDTLRVGDPSIGVEAPTVSGLSCTICDGIITGIDRDVMLNGRQMTVIRTSASSGGAGGPLFNCYGQMVALRTVMFSRNYGYSQDSTCYAIPVSAAKPVVDQLLDQGFVTDRPSIGISAEDLPERVRIYYGLPSGAYVTFVRSGSAADQAGIRAGDILTELDGQPIAGAAVLEQIRNDYSADDVIELTIYRGGEYFRVPIPLTQQEQSN